MHSRVRRDDLMNELDNKIDMFGTNDIKNEYDELVKVMNYHCDRY